jgi:hypothetical protein
VHRCLRCFRTATPGEPPPTPQTGRLRRWLDEIITWREED